MSAEQTEADFDESVFDGAPADNAAAAKPEAAAPAEEAKATDPKSKIADIAKKIGHAGKDEWKGDPDDWLDAPEFILKAAGEVLPSMRKSLEKANDEIAGLKKSVKASIQHLTKARQEGYEQRSRELQTELAEYAKAGDVENVKSVTADIVALEKEVTAAPAAEAADDEPPEFTEWKAANPWYGVDKPLTAACVAIGNEVFEEGYSGKAQAKEVDRRLREQFPGKFAPAENPNRKLPGTVEGAGSARRPGGKGFSDMPKEHQEMCADLMKLTPTITKDSYAKEFFAEEKR